ncbi:polyprenyl synthetase family protein [Tepidicella baoligensis]|uniref:polyprenyl synthetase family protein n=1 Tax=Tepidicella baoligensis TaxID=2707016 RepID=UPI0015DB2D69|nr:farnesyl diphosphate synthase [Tepidicella baoligensis]
MTHEPITAFKVWVADALSAVESALQAWLPRDAPAGLGDAMRYAVLDGGKRLRPLLALGAAESVGGGRSEAVMRAACAVELIHAYSLVHDDLPCMDNDVLRRGKPTVHVRYGQAQALLAGDALQALAFEWLLAIPDEALAARLARRLAQAAGHAGMAGGQAIDLAEVGQVLTQARLEEMHRRKTGALLLASVQMGAQAAGADERALAALTAYGEALGLAFQVVDDVLDVVADTATLGKTAGKDAAADKPTFVSLLGLDGARRYADALLSRAHQALGTGALARTDRLQHLADWVVRRTH